MHRKWWDQSEYNCTLLPTGQAVIQISLVPKHPKLEVASGRRKDFIKMPFPRIGTQRICQPYLQCHLIMVHRVMIPLAEGQGKKTSRKQVWSQNYFNWHCPTTAFLYHLRHPSHLSSGAIGGWQHEVQDTEVCAKLKKDNSRFNACLQDRQKEKWLTENRVVVRACHPLG